MNEQVDKYPIDLPQEILSYIEVGYHAFIGCDDPGRRDEIVALLKSKLSSNPVECTDGRGLNTYREFAEAMAKDCKKLSAALGIRSRIAHSLRKRALSISQNLEETMRAFDVTERQGFLILNHIDPIISSQRTVEIEGSLRSVMQLRDEVAVILCGSNDVIDGMVGDYDRPFYLSFRVFRL